MQLRPAAPLFAFLVLLGSAASPCSTAAAEPAVSGQPTAWLQDWQKNNPLWRGVHFTLSSDQSLQSLLGAVPRFPSNGVNVLVVEVNYAYEFASHPDLRQPGFVKQASARQLAAACRAHGIRLIPGFNCLGHQSWSRQTAPLLAKRPEFDETPGQYPNNTNIYCRSWCPQHPGLNAVIFALLDDLAAGFEADAMHVGMDEVFLIASEHCTRCKGGDPAKLFAKAAADLHGHLAGKRGLEVLIWGDRLLDSKALGYSEWEAARNSTGSAIDLLPKDIIVCDWHYGRRAAYPSVPLLLEKGFRVWPSGWQPLEATVAFSEFARQQRAANARVLGYLCTTWGKVKPAEAPEWPSVVEPLKPWRKP
jgi:hypothetical protein